MPRGVDEVEGVLLFPAAVKEAAGLEFYGYAALLFDVHVVEELFLHLARGDSPRLFDEAVGESALAVVDVRDYAEVAYPVKAQCFSSHPQPAEFGQSVDFIII